MMSEHLIPAVAVRFKALSDPSRLRLLSCLHQKEHSVSELVAMTGRRQPSVSQSLGQLAAAGLVAPRREGSRMIYRLSDPYIARICDAVCRSVSESVRKQARALAGAGTGRSRQRA
jgi:ArsR family transcriptional regulator